MAELVFTVDSALLSELGEKLVETAHIALVELVKNAYDADATEVAVKILPQSAGGPEIHVIDNGSGMTFHDVERYWMRIATTHKADIKVSTKFGRPRTGSKGIGRFSCRRLGTSLKLQTMAAVDGGTYEQTEISFDWLKFKPGKEISTIKCDGIRKKIRQASTGTTLVISGSPTDEWRKRGYNFARRQLAVLAANRGRKRAGFEEDPGFNVTLEAPGFTDQLANLRDQLLDAGWGDVSLRVTANGDVNCTLNAKRIGEKAITYPMKMPNLVGVYARIGIMPIDRQEMRNREILSNQSLSEILDEWGGVYVRYKGFRVYPFGEPGNDWLNIDRDRAIRKGSLSDILQPFASRLRGVNPQRALLALLSNKSHIGDVEIDERAKGFELKASREGFVGEDAIASLSEIIRFAIDWATMYREHSKDVALREEARKARMALAGESRHTVEPREVIASAIRVVENEFRNLATELPTAKRQQVLRTLKTATEAIEKHEASSREELRHLQLIASTSTLLLIFSHEVKALLSWLEQVNISLERLQRKVNEPEATKLQTIRDEFDATKNRFVDLLSMTSLISVGGRRSEPERLTLRSRLEKAKQCFDLIVSSYDIDLDIDQVPGSLQVGPMLEAELYAVLLNILSNAIKSVIAAGGQKRIQVIAERRPSDVVMHVLDSGIGIKEENFEQVFSPFVSDPEKRLYRGLDAKLNPEDNYIIGTGSGLGLSIVREILSNRRGTIRFILPNGHWSADLEVILP